MTLLALNKQAESFSKQPPVGIEGITMREQAFGEMNGLQRFAFESDNILKVLIEEHEELKNKPKMEEQEQHED